MLSSLRGLITNPVDPEEDTTEDYDDDDDVVPPLEPIDADRRTRISTNDADSLPDLEPVDGSDDNNRRMPPSERTNAARVTIDDDNNSIPALESVEDSSVEAYTEDSDTDDSESVAFEQPRSSSPSVPDQTERILQWVENEGGGSSDTQEAYAAIHPVEEAEHEEEQEGEGEPDNEEAADERPPFVTDGRGRVIGTRSLLSRVLDVFNINLM